MATQQLSWVLTAQDATASAFGSVDRRLLALGGRVTGVGTAFKVMAVLAVAAFASIVSATAEFDKWMRNVNSISHFTEESLNSLSKQVLDLARDLPLKGAAVDLARGLYEIASSGFYGAEGLEILNRSARAASAGLTTTQNSAKAIVGVLNAYGLEASDAADVSDALFQTVNLGIITFEELSQQLGDVIGLSAAAGVEIDEVGAAIAAITLAGIPAAEAFTSLNQLFRKLLDPSKALSALYSELGIVIGRDLKDPAIGLYGIMEQLRKATGGSVEAFIQLFPEIRAARGAFALTANDGQNFARTMAGIADESERAGATQKALDEQMKSLSAQWRVLANHINVAATELGSKWLPALIGVVNWIDDLAVGMGRLAQQGFAYLEPFFRGIREIFESMGNALERVGDKLLPVAAGFAAINAALLLTTLNLVIQPFVFLADLMERYPGILAVVATGFGIILAKAIYTAVAAMAAWIGGQIYNALWSIANVVVTLAQNFASLSLVLKGITLAGVVGAVILLAQAFQGASKDAEQTYKILTQGFDLTTYEGLRSALQNVTAEISNLETAQKKVNPVSPWSSKEYTAMSKELASLKTHQEELARSSTYLSENIGAVGRATGLTKDQVKELAGRLGVDLTKGFKESEGGRTKLIDHLKGSIALVAGAGRGLQELGQIMPEEFEKMAKAAGDFIEKASEAFTKDTNLVSGFAGAVSDHEKALKGLADANKKLGNETGQLQDVRSRMAADTKISVSDEQSLANAMESVGEAAKEVADAQKEVDNTSLEGYFKRQLEEAKTFSSGIQKVAQDGLNPQLVADLLVAGPKAAAPLLSALTGEHGKNLIGIANQTQETLNLINNQVIESARVTHLAITTRSLSMAQDFDLAMAILRVKAAKGGKATVDQVATELGLLPSRVAQIAGDYIIVLDGMARDANGKVIPPTITMADTIIREWARAEGDAAEAASRMGIKTGIHVNAMAVDAIFATNNMANEMVGNITRGADQTANKMRDWANTTRAEMQGLIGEFVSPETVYAARGDSGNIFSRAMGGYLPRDATFQPEGTRVQWAEPGTGGEWFFPNAPNRRRPDLVERMLEMWGYAMVPKGEKYAMGGQRDEFGLTPPPDYRPSWTWPTAGAVSGGVYDQARMWASAAAASVKSMRDGAIGSGQVGQGWREITDYLDSIGTDYTVTSTTGGQHAEGSYHYLGKAVDLVGDNMMEIFNTLLNIGHSLAELFYDPAGFSLKNGERVDWTLGDHFDHVHAATFDRGGVFKPGWNMAYNGLGRDEPVMRLPDGLDPTGGQAGAKELALAVKEAVKAALAESTLQVDEVPFVLEMDGEQVTVGVSRRMASRSRGRSRQ